VNLASLEGSEEVIKKNLLFAEDDLFNFKKKAGGTTQIILLKADGENVNI